MACSCDLQRHKERSSPDHTDLDLTSTLIHTIDRSGRYLGMGVVVCVCVRRRRMYKMRLKP